MNSADEPRAGAEFLTVVVTLLLENGAGDVLKKSSAIVPGANI